MQGSLQFFTLGLHSCALSFEHCGTLWERFLEPGVLFLLSLGLWRAPGEPSGPNVQCKGQKRTEKERNMSPKGGPLEPFLLLWDALGLQFETPGGEKGRHKAQSHDLLTLWK